MVMVASVEPHHKPVVSHGSSHLVFCLATTHSRVAHAHMHTHTRDSGRRCGGKHGVDETTHTPHHEHHALKPKWQAHTMPSQWLSQSMVHCALACVCGQVTCCTHTHTRTGKWRDHRSQAANTQATTNNHHTNTHQTSLMVVTHTGWSLTHTHQGQAGQGAQQDQGSGGNGLHSDHAMAQACNTSGHATMACAPSPRATHASGHVHTHPHSATTHKRERKEELGEGPQGVERHSGVSETVPLCHPPCPQVSTPPTVRPASPPPGPPSTTHTPPVSEWRHRRVRVWRHTRHTVWCNQHSQPPLSHSHKCPHQHTPTTNPPHTHAHTHGGWERRGWHTLAKKARRPGHGTVWCG